MNVPERVRLRVVQRSVETDPRPRFRSWRPTNLLSSRANSGIRMRRGLGKSYATTYAQSTRITPSISGGSWMRSKQLMNRLPRLGHTA